MCPTSYEQEKYRKRVYHSLLTGVLRHRYLTIPEAEQVFFADNDPVMLDEALEKAGYATLLDFINAHWGEITWRTRSTGLALYPGARPAPLMLDLVKLIHQTPRHPRPNPRDLEAGIMSDKVQRRLHREGRVISVGVVAEKCRRVATGGPSAQRTNAGQTRALDDGTGHRLGGVQRAGTIRPASPNRVVPPPSGSGVFDSPGISVTLSFPSRVPETPVVESPRVPSATPPSQENVLNTRCVEQQTVATTHGPSACEGPSSTDGVMRSNDRVTADDSPSFIPDTSCSAGSHAPKPHRSVWKERLAAYAVFSTDTGSHMVQPA